VAAEVDIDSLTECPLGQVYGHYFESPWEARFSHNAHMAWERGFMYREPEERDQLNAEWKRLIESRRTAVILDA
jgi:hypothetical protein